MEGFEQISLIPKEIPTVENLDVLLSDLPDNHLLLGPAPKPKTINSMERYGQIDPIVLVQTSTGYEVADGTGRIKSARILGWQTIRASVYPEGVIDIEAIALIANEHRRSNPIRDLDNILKLEKKGISEKAIQNELGLSPSTYKKRIKLKDLVPPLKEAMGQGILLVKQGEACAKMTVDQQSYVAQKLQENGKVTETDLHEATRAHRQEFEEFLKETAIEAQQQSMLDDGFFGGLGWEDQVLDHLIQILDIIPLEQEELRSSFKSIAQKMGAHI